MMKAPLVPVTLAFLAGVLCDAPAPSWALLVLIAIGVLSAAAAIRRRRESRWALPGLMLLWLCLGLLRMDVWRSHPDAQLSAILPDEPAPVRLHGVVISDPVQPFDPQEAEPQVCVLLLRHVRTEEGWQPIAGRVRAMFSGPLTPLAYGDEVLVEGDWSRIPVPGNPGQYDWRAALSRQRIHGKLQVKPSHGLLLLGHDRGRPWVAAVSWLRQRWERLIRERFTEQEAGLLLSLLLGQRVALDERLNDAFIETGTIHLLVISGSNVALIALLLEGCFRLIGLPWRLRLVLSAIGLGGYALLTGWQPPVVRAMLMAWVVLGAYAMDRVISWSNTLAAAALAVVWMNPSQLFDPGFQLSFGAVLCLLVFTGRWQAWLEPHLGWLRPTWLRRYVSISLSATSAVWVGLAPVLAWYFHLVAPVSMLANLIVAPLMSALVCAGTFILILATFLSGALAWGQGLLTLLLSATVRAVSWCHAIPGGCWFVGHPAPLFLLGYYGLVALSVLRSRLRWSPARVLILWVAGIVLWIWSAVARSTVESRWLRVDILDVGHGDSILVRTPDHDTLLVDTGSQEAGRFQVLPFLRHEGITTLDVLVLTHTDEDHLGGAIPLLQHLRVRRLVTNGVPGDTISARMVRSLIKAQGIGESVVVAGMRLDVGPGAAIDVLHPPPGLVPGTIPKSNDNGIVLKLTKGVDSILLTGDVEEAGLPWLLRANGALRSTVLKVPHHGSRLGEIGERFFNAVQPEIAVLSVGRVHHLPAPETLDALRRTGARLYSTRQDGAVSLRTDGERLEVHTFRGGTELNIDRDSQP